MALANNGGINSFLTCPPELAASEVVSALKQIGAGPAAEQLEEVLLTLGEDLPAGSQKFRDDTLDRLWTAENDVRIDDVVSDEADHSLYSAIAKHAERNVDYYLALDARFKNAGPAPSPFKRLLTKLFQR